MPDAMSPEEIEALFAQLAAAAVGAPEPSSDDRGEDAAATVGATATSSPELAAESFAPTVSDSVTTPAPDLVDDAGIPAPPVAPEVFPDPPFGRRDDFLAGTPTPDDLLIGTAATQAGTAVDAALSDDRAASADAGSATHTTIANLFAQYGKYVALFVGAGLISGSVVHFPLAPVRYAVIGAVGALLFAIASVVSELGDRDPLRLARVAVSSLALAVGIGMVSGSIQHFMDIPDRAALLIPLGVVLSLAAFGIRHGLRLKRTDLALIVPWLIIAVFALGFGLSKLADVAAAQGGGAGHGHESGPADGHGGEAGGADAGAAADAAHAEDAARAEDDAHAEDAAPAGDDAHAGDDQAAGKPGRGDASGKDPALAAEESHGGRLRLVP